MKKSEIQKYLKKDSVYFSLDVIRNIRTMDVSTILNKIKGIGIKKHQLNSLELNYLKKVLKTYYNESNKLNQHVINTNNHKLNQIIMKTTSKTYLNLVANFAVKQEKNKDNVLKLVQNSTLSKEAYNYSPMYIIKKLKDRGFKDSQLPALDSPTLLNDLHKMFNTFAEHVSDYRKTYGINQKSIAFKLENGLESKFIDTSKLDTIKRLSEKVDLLLEFLDSIQASEIFEQYESEKIAEKIEAENTEI